MGIEDGNGRVVDGVHVGRSFQVCDRLVNLSGFFSSQGAVFRGGENARVQVRVNSLAVLRLYCTKLSCCFVVLLPSDCCGVLELATFQAELLTRG